jgi:hypothetical protein
VGDGRVFRLRQAEPRRGSSAGRTCPRCRHRAPAARGTRTTHDRGGGAVPSDAGTGSREPSIRPISSRRSAQLSPPIGVRPQPTGRRLRASRGPAGSKRAAAGAPVICCQPPATGAAPKLADEDDPAQSGVCVERGAQISPVVSRDRPSRPASGVLARPETPPRREFGSRGACSGH